MSDQDFFFDDEDAAPEKAQAVEKPSGQQRKPAKAAPKASKPSAVTDAQATGSGQLFEQNVTLAVAALLMVIALLIGVIIGIFVGGAISGPATPASSITAPETTGGGNAAPLSPDQLNSGELPAGHPDIGGGGAATATPTP